MRLCGEKWRLEMPAGGAGHSTRLFKSHMRSQASLYVYEDAEDTRRSVLQGPDGAGTGG